MVATFEQSEGMFAKKKGIQKLSEERQKEFKKILTKEQLKRIDKKTQGKLRKEMRKILMKSYEP